MYWTTLRVSSAFDMTFSQFLSTPWKRLLSCGSCFAMSPDVKTASRYCHIAWTCVHTSRTSETAPSFETHAWTPSRNGAT